MSTANLRLEARANENFFYFISSIDIKINACCKLLKHIAYLKMMLLLDSVFQSLAVVYSEIIKKYTCGMKRVNNFSISSFYNIINDYFYYYYDRKDINKSLRWLAREMGAFIIY